MSEFEEQGSEASDDQVVQDTQKQAVSHYAQALLSATRYHQQIVEHFSSCEPKVWAWFSNLSTLEKSFAQTRDSLLKSTYRLSSDAYQHVYDLAKLAMQRLGIDEPITLYQANDGAMNAALFYIPKEIHIVFYGALLEKISDQELLAILGHELSHYILWSINSSQYLAAQQLLEDSCQQASHNNALYETARLYGLNTEIFADRGAVIASQSPNDTVSVLLKVMTGLSQVDANSFLEQANELNEKNETSAARSHPELYLRALLAHKWHSYLENARTDVTEQKTVPPESEEKASNADIISNDELKEIDDWIDSKLKGTLHIHALDVLDQKRLCEMTAFFFHYFLDLELADNNTANKQSIVSELVKVQLQTFFPTWPQIEVAPYLNIEYLKEATQDKSVKQYFIALIFDIAHADKEQIDEVLAQGAKVSAELDWLADYQENLKAILHLQKRQIDKFVKPYKNLSNESSSIEESGGQS